MKTRHFSRKLKFQRPHRCPHCTYASFTSHHLKRHLLTHTGEKPYQCDTCHARFTKKYILTAHKSIHKGKKTVFQCHDCGIIVADRCTFDVHACFKCHLCDYVTLWQRHYESHMYFHMWIDACSDLSYGNAMPWFEEELEEWLQAEQECLVLKTRATLRPIVLLSELRPVD